MKFYYKKNIHFFTQDDPYTILTIFLLGRPCPSSALHKYRVKTHTDMWATPRPKAGKAISNS